MTASELRYRPEVFDVATVVQAKQIILTTESGTSTEERWAKETPFLVSDIGLALMLTDAAVVLDYGCGIGRLSKELIERFNCFVIGVDISASMRQLAVEYVNSDRFCAVSPDMLGSLIAKGVTVDACFSIWVLQHCLDVHKEIQIIRQALKPEGLLYILNCYDQVIPTDAGWATAGVNVLELLQQEFSPLRLSKLPVECTTSGLSATTYIALLKNDKQVAEGASEENCYSGLSAFIEKLARDLYPENPSELHNDITEKVIRHMVEKYPVGAGKEILDVGCGQGVALEHFKKMGAKALGVTLGDDDISVCHKLGFNVRKMDQSFLDFADNCYDVVWARHVIEHSIFPLYTLAGFNRVLKPGGILYLEVPAPDTDCHHEINPNHYSVLTRSSWRVHIIRSGFEIYEELTLSFQVDAGSDEYWGFFCKKSSKPSL